MLSFSSTNKRRVLSLFSLVMINVTAVDSLRTLPISAEYGLSLVFYYGVAALLFFIPSALVSAELATGWPKTGGIYIWVREAFGKPAGFLTIWLQWIYNICWYPTILTLMAATLAYLVNPHLVNNKLYMLSFVMVVFWTITMINSFGMQMSSRLIDFTTLTGTLLPMMLIALLGAFWWLAGNPIHFQISTQALLPDLSHFNNMVLMTAVLYGLIGMELAAMHAQESKNPERDYPKVMLIAGVIILTTLVLGSLAVAAVVPKHELQLVDGLLKAFQLFFQAYHMSWMMPVIGVLIILGAIGGVSAWVIGPTKGLMVCAEDGSLPRVFAKTNRYYAPTTMLICQGIIFTLLCSVFLLMPSVNSGFWVLTDITSQLALLVYVAMFAAVIRLRYKYPHVKRAFRIPGGKLGVWMTGLAGMSSSIFAIGLGFLPPSQVKDIHLGTYELILWSGMIIACVVPLLIHHVQQRYQRTEAQVNSI